MSKSYYAIGTYNTGITPSNHLSRNGICMIELDELTGSLRLIKKSRFLCNPSYLCKRNNEKKLYAVSEMMDSDGLITCFIITDDMDLVKVKEFEGPGRAACHVAVHDNLPLLYSASYHDGKFEIINMDEGCRTIIQCTGSGPNTTRQEHSHAHQVMPIGDSVILVSDLGSDTIWKYDELTHSLSLFWKAPSGSGPRHMVMDPSDGTIYLACELTPYIFAISNEGKTLQKIEYPFDADAAAIRMHPSGKTLAVSYRKNNHILILDIMREEDGSRLRTAAEISSKGEVPRDFAFSSSGDWILMLNQDSDSIISQRINHDSGLPEGHEQGFLHITTPVSIIEL